jgi:diguanylate cyclase (GGDEF)-like protein
MRVRFILGLAAVAAMAAGSILGALAVRSSENEEFEHRQRHQVLRAATQAESQAALSISQLASAAAFYQTEEDISRHEFEVMADSLLERGALSSTAFIEAVRRPERVSFERSNGYPIVERRPPRAFRRADEGRLYFPLTHAEVDQGAVGVPLGYDVGTDPVRKTHLLRARDTGRADATSVVRLSSGGTGINVFRPVYEDGAPTDSVGQRRSALIGFAAGAFQVSDLATAAEAVLPSRVDAQLIEGGRRVAGEPFSREDATAAPVQIADRTWLLVVPDPSRPGVALPVLMAVLGLALAALLGSLVVIWSRNERMQVLQQQASHDPLTGLKNRRRFDEDLRTELARSRREGTEGGLLMLDLDNFKQVNDTLGHPIGDQVIGEIAGVLRGRTRETDVLARLGGDEFAIVLPHCGIEEARAIAEQIATAIREHVPTEAGVPPITASIGVAMFGPDARHDFETLQVEADAAMYEAKQAGRDSVHMAGIDPAGSAAETSSTG